MSNYNFNYSFNITGNCNAAVQEIASNVESLERKVADTTTALGALSCIYNTFDKISGILNFDGYEHVTEFITLCYRNNFWVDGRFDCLKVVFEFENIKHGIDGIKNRLFNHCCEIFYPNLRKVESVDGQKAVRENSLLTEPIAAVDEKGLLKVSKEMRPIIFNNTKTDQGLKAHKEILLKKEQRCITDEFICWFESFYKALLHRCPNIVTATNCDGGYGNVVKKIIKGIDKITENSINGKFKYTQLSGTLRNESWLRRNERIKNGKSYDNIVCDEIRGIDEITSAFARIKEQKEAEVQGKQIKEAERKKKGTKTIQIEKLIETVVLDRTQNQRYKEELLNEITYALEGVMSQINCLQPY